MIYLVFAKAHKDTTYRVVLYFFPEKSVNLIFIFNFVFMVRLAVDVWVYSHRFRHSIIFQSLSFIKDFELNSALYN